MASPNEHKPTTKLMSDFPYTTVPGKLNDLLEKIRTVGIPDKATVQWLKAIGFTSSNDSSLLPVLKFIDFCSEAGNPTDRWQNFRGHDWKSVLGLAIQHGYSDLFAVYSDANLRTDAELTSFFNTRSTAGAQAIRKTVSTFKTLCRDAAFGTSGSAVQRTHIQNAPSSQNTVAPTTPSGGPEVHLDIQIHISSDASAEQIDQMFASMAKHLYGREA